MNAGEVLLSTNDVSVQYRIASRTFGSFKEFVLARIKRQKYEVQEFQALDQVSVELKAGECVGLIGHNGCGKSTLLKVMAGILTAKEGQVAHKGRLTSLIELGAGFDPELNAVDNIHLACTLMGVGRKEIKANLQNIIAFAELENFLDLPMKNYSSGMYARLAFACATVVDADIILVDEVLAVGDEAFQSKCYRRIDDLKRQNKGIILVSHDMVAVKRFCDRVYVLHHGKKIFQGDVDQAIAKYRELLNTNPSLS